MFQCIQDKIYFEHLNIFWFLQSFNNKQLLKNFLFNIIIHSASCHHHTEISIIVFLITDYTRRLSKASESEQITSQQRRKSARVSLNQKIKLFFNKPVIFLPLKWYQNYPFVEGTREHSFIICLLFFESLLAVIWLILHFSCLTFYIYS